MQGLSADALGELVEKVKSGDVEAFRQLYDHFGTKIVNYIYRLTGSRAEAEDLAQDTFVLAFNKIQTLQENSKFQSWLFRIAQNNVYQRYRGKQPQVESLDVDDEGGQTFEARKLASSEKGPEEQILAEELHEVVRKVISELPPKYREVFILSAIQHLSYQEICEIVGRSLASVKSDIHRARVFVRDRVKEYLGENYGMSGML